MKIAKRTAIAAAIFISVAATPLPSFASGIPVIDVAAIAQAIQQVTYLQQQLTQMQNQLQAMTGDRGMAGLLSGQNRNYLPPDWNSAMSLLNNGSGGSYGALTSAVQQIKQAQSVLTGADLNRLSPQMQQYLDQVRNVSASQQALGQQAYATASQRVSLLQTLTNQISSATDPKAVWDLQARIQSEQTQLQNDQSRLQSVAQLTQAQSVATKQMANELRAQSSGSGNFPTLDTSVGSN
ncbi:MULTISPECIES: type IV secretion system protein [Burkholderia cepacia complex]|uniref:type IV secretion system protein n=1 Tax=Burkholderia cepacia complex TaxID=87882 RepID=UPI000D00F02C|nr:MULTISPECIES: type IV secretion system protein [Burkholderia cepacia complex]MBR8373941.1 type IV secretion system protein [Burkholderia cenocepacia]MBR8442953.1 type IV secretion system protein [Burkholderia cenocepacia]MBU9122933.1 type IV secretion system protein [Burkholderia multivorans]MDN7867563.1 type IV secretion system protein [Burkholderia multivorans]MDR8920781.1 Type IV secretion system protein virB5 [Burkholderia multivorans]